MKKFLVIIIHMIILITGCTDTSTDLTQNPLSMGDVVREEVELDWYVNLSWWERNAAFGKDLVTKTILEKTGVKINFITPSTDVNQQLDTMITSGKLPDLVSVESWLGYQTRMAEAGIIYDMDTLINNYAPSFRDILKPDIYEWYQEIDGKTYGFPNYAYSSYDMKEGERLESNACFVLRKDIYDAIGRPEFSTANEFLEVLELVQKEYGKDIIPLQMYEFTDTGNTTVDVWLPEYFAVPYEDDKGQYLNIRRQPQFMEVLTFVNKAYRQGYIKPDNFTDSRAQINKKISDGRVFAILGATQDFENQFKELYQMDSNYQYEAFVITNEVEDDPVLSDISGFGWLFTMIPKTCKYPDKAIQLLEFLSSDEGQMLAFFGVEGVTYNLDANGTAIWTDAYREALKLGIVEKKYGIRLDLMANWMFAKDIFEAPLDDYLKYQESLKEPIMKYSTDKRATYLKIDRSNPQAYKMSGISNKINLYWGTYLPKLIMSESEIALIETYISVISEMDAMGMKLLDAYNDDAYQKAKDLLGKK